MKQKVLILGLILILTAFFRLYRLNQVPIELFGDELDVGYQAYSILKTGKDIRGYSWPSYFHSLSEYRAPLYLYLTVPFVVIFGLNEWGVRLPAVFFGLIGIWLMYLLGRILFKDERIGRLAAFVMAILPWHIHYSRAGFEVTLLLTLILAAIFFFLKGLNDNNFKSFILSCLFFILALYTYSTAILFLVLFLPISLFIFWPKLKKVEKRWLGIGLIILLAGLVPLVWGIFSNQAGERFSKISIIFDKKLIENIINKRGFEAPIGRLFHNKATEIGKQFTINYLSAFSGDFLFLKGDPNPRHSVGTTGEIYLVFLPFLIWGIFDSLKNINQKTNKFLLLWLLISPAPSALTIGGGNHATRLFLMLPPLVILISRGVIHLIDLKEKKFKIFNFSLPAAALAKVGFLIFLSLNSLSYFHQYYIHYPIESWQFWHYGYKEAIRNLGAIDSNYERVILNNSHEPILIRLLFWAKKDPRWFQENFKNDQEIKDILPGFDGFKVGKYYFGRLQNKENLPKFLDSQTLYLAFQKDEIPGDWDWSKNPPGEVMVLKMIKNPLGDSFISLLTGTK